MIADPKKFRDGFSDGLEPLVPIDVAAEGSISGLLSQLTRTSFGGRAFGEGADTLERMIRDPDCFVVCTISGAMTVAKMGLVLCEMIDRGYIHAIVSTGALMAHGFVESTGRSHFKYDSRMTDVDLYEAGYDRVYDTLELEKSLDDVSRITQEVVGTIPDDTVLSSALIMTELGRYLDESLPSDARAILKSCYRKGVPVYVPAFTDSELGLNVEMLNQARMREDRARYAFDPFLDLVQFGRLLSAQKHRGIFTIGGGVPRNWAQQLGPLIDLMQKRLGRRGEAFRYRYGLRICPEPVHWGDLSGCTYSEGVSWGKFVPVAEGGRFSEVYADATIVWPLLVRAMIERISTVDKTLPVPADIEQVLLEA